MLVLLSFGLVLVATVLLVLGLLTDGGLTFIYISIGLSVAAAIVLVVAVRLAKSKEAAPGGAPAPLLEPEEEELVPVGGPAAATGTEAAASPVGTSAAVGAAEPAEGGQWETGGEQEWESGEDWGDEPEFPIAEYDDLKVSEILPLLPQLYADELDVVEARERQGKSRATILTEISGLRLKGGYAVDPAVGAGEEAEQDWEVDDEAEWEGGEPTAEAEPADDDDDDYFPIEDYDVLSAGEIVGVLGELDDDELEMVREREFSTRNRRTILANIERRLGVAAAPVKKAPAPRKVAAPAPAKTAPAPAKKAATSAKKAPAPAPTKKAAAPAKRAPAPAKKAATPAKKAAAPAKKAAAPAKKAATPAKKAAAPAKKAAAPAKKAAKKR